MQFNGPQSHILFVGNLWGPCRRTEDGLSDVLLKNVTAKEGNCHIFRKVINVKQEIARK